MAFFIFPSFEKLKITCNKQNNKRYLNLININLVVLMLNQDVKIFKLHYSGDIEIWDEATGDPIELFSTVNILAIYVGEAKRLYVWVGPYASRTLKRYITQFRELFTKEYWDYRVLRYITIEAMSEPYEFFKTVGIEKSQLHEHIKNHENKLLPVISKIESLKDKEDKLFESEKYKDAIDIAKKIVELAKEIDDPLLERDQEDFMKGARERLETVKIMREIEQQNTDLTGLISMIFTDDDIIKLHKAVLEFKRKYKDYIELQNIYETQNILIQEDRIWKKFCEKLSEIERLNMFEEDIRVALSRNNLKISGEILEKAQEIVNFLQDEDLTNKWDVIDKDYNEKNNYFTVQVAHLEERFNENMKDGNLEGAASVSEGLIHIGDTFNDKALVKKYNELKKEIEEELNKLRTTRDEELALRAKDFETLNKLEKDIRVALNDNNIKVAGEILPQAKGILEILKDEELNDKWEDVENEYNDMLNYFNEQLAKLEESLNENIKIDNVQDVVNDCEGLINLGETYKDKELANKYKKLLEEWKAKLKDLGKELGNLKEQIIKLTKKARDTLFDGQVNGSLVIFEDIVTKFDGFNF